MANLNLGLPSTVTMPGGMSGGAAGMTPGSGGVAGGGGLGAAGAAGIFAGLSLLQGLFGYLDFGEKSKMAESRARMLRNEAEAEAELYGLQARRFQGRQSMLYTKSGVALTGSPLLILDETARTAAENISAIRSRGTVGAASEELNASAYGAAGRSALIGGLSRGAQIFAMGAYQSKQYDRLGRPRNA